jgi:hypothetical protein
MGAAGNSGWRQTPEGAGWATPRDRTIVRSSRLPTKIMMLTLLLLPSSAGFVGFLARMWKRRRWTIWALLTLLCQAVLYAYTHFGLVGAAPTDSLYRAALILTSGGSVLIASIILSTLPRTKGKADA